MKLAGKKRWISSWFRDLSPTTNGAPTDIFSNGGPRPTNMERIPIGYKLLGLAFATIGIMGTLRWTVTTLFNLDAWFSSPSLSAGDTSGEGAVDTCAGPSHMLSDLTERLHILEAAFKEQVFARETIVREINDQSDIYGTLDRKLTTFLDRLENISADFTMLEAKYTALSGRVFTDELLGTVVVLMLVLQLFYLGRPLVEKLSAKLVMVRPELGRLLKQEKLERKQTSSNPGTPIKHQAGLRNEICVVVFQRDSANSVFVNLSDAMLRHLEAVRVAAKPYYTVFSQDDLRNMPHVRLYVIVVDLEARGAYINGSEKDLVIMTVKLTKSIGGSTVVIIANDEGSKNLTAHSNYNSSIRMVKSNHCLQELAADGKLFSMWQEMTSHQLSHLRRVIKTVLNVKLVMR